jgi:hypothetical protein
MSELGTVYKSERGYEIAGFEWMLGWPLVFGGKELAQGCADVLLLNFNEAIDNRTSELNQQLEASEARVKELEATINKLHTKHERDLIAFGEEARSKVEELEGVLGEIDKTLSTNITQYGVSIHDAVEDARELIASALQSTTPAPESEAPKPKFAVGDKVRVARVNYPQDSFDTVEVIENGKYSLRTWLDDKHGRKTHYLPIWSEGELTAYTEAPQDAVTLMNEETFAELYADTLLSGTIQGLKKILTRNHEPMATFHLIGVSVAFVVVFPRTFAKYKNLLVEGAEISTKLKHDTSKEPVGNFILVDAKKRS